MAKKIMGAYEIASHRRARRAQLRVCLAALITVGLLGAAGAAMELRGRIPTTAPESAPAQSEPAQSEPAQSEAQQPSPAEPVNKSAWNVGTPVAQTLDAAHYSPDWRMNALPAVPAVELSYFDTATFVGDSLTQGLELYSTGLQIGRAHV